METFKKIADLKSQIRIRKNENKSVGFVPTMGALHEGHISLVKMARERNDVVVVSIFVNPIQFNNPEDLDKYPRTFEEDALLLKEAGVDYIFYPEVKEMYPEEVKETYDFGSLAEVLEGAFRPGHFNGVGVVVKRLFDIVEPNQAYFGKKDFQQLAIIRKLVEIENIPVEIIAGETKREHDGLAMSSRNVRLTRLERTKAPQIFANLQYTKVNQTEKSPKELEEAAIQNLSSNFNVEYFKICDGNSLQGITSWEETNYPVALVAANIGTVRLIDNLEL
jgi:pantoate--beta-alanine ligase